MPQAETRRLAAIMFTDMVGFSRQMGADEARMLRMLKVGARFIAPFLLSSYDLRTFTPPVPPAT